MPRRSQTEQDSRLPQPELNPLVNPLLGQHMGRWAEVYFTAPPDQREEAVLALLRELESERENASEPSASGFSEQNLVQRTQNGPSLSAGRTESIKGETVICKSCGQTVSQAQRFCGMCGAVMYSEPGDAKTSDRVQRPIQTTSGGSAQQFDQSDFRTEQINHEDINRKYLRGERYSPDAGDDLPETVFSFGGNVSRPVSEERVPYRYRIYLGAALAILIGVLLLMAYRATRDWSASSRALPEPAPSGAQANAAAPKAATPVQAAADNDRRRPENGDRNAEPKVTPFRNTERTTAAAPAPATVGSPSSATSNSAAANHGNGTEELTVAERFLNGGQGTARDSGEAAKWLWQSVRKENGTATLLLSDLYLRGDGVPKNCDQARLLLDAAARKGTPGAGQRLRNLQAFGCQ